MAGPELVLFVVTENATADDPAFWVKVPAIALAAGKEFVVNAPEIVLVAVPQVPLTTQ